MRPSHGRTGASIMQDRGIAGVMSCHVMSWHRRARAARRLQLPQLALKRIGALELALVFALHRLHQLLVPLRRGLHSRHSTARPPKRRLI